jgi:hypothetical protein
MTTIETTTSEAALDLGDDDGHDDGHDDDDDDDNDDDMTRLLALTALTALTGYAPPTPNPNRNMQAPTARKSIDGSS